MDQVIIQAILGMQTSPIKSILATIIHTEGSTPRGPGTQMLIMENGQTTGTIGGGTAERIVSQRALELLTVDSEVTAEIHRIEINQETSTAKLSACGANIDVLLEPVQEKNFWQFALDLQMKGIEAMITTSLVFPYSKSILDSQGQVLWGPPQTGLQLSAERSQSLFSGMQTEVIVTSDGSNWLIEPILKTKRLLILGAGHVAREVAYYAKPLDFQVTVIDDRAAFALPEFFPGAHEVICTDFASGIKNYQPNGETYVVIATWSHQTDSECLKDVLNFSAKYVGMLGSTKKVATIVKKLQEDGYSAQNLARLRAPIGLDIKAQTPSEIAISILAEIISVR